MKRKRKGFMVFNNENHKSLQWTEDGSIIATLSFGAGNRREDCFLYCDDIVALYSPDAMVRFERWDLRVIEDAMNEPERPEKFRNRKPPASKIVTLANFRKKPQ